VTARTDLTGARAYVRYVYVRLNDGTEVLIRPIRAGDKRALATAFGHLSAETVHRRFLSPKPQLSAAELRYLTEVDGDDHVAFVAVLAERPEWLVAVGRFVRLADDPEAAEFAIVVGDPWQNRGLGKRIASLLAAEAVAHGVHRFTAFTLADNIPAQRLIETIAQRLTFQDGAGGIRELAGELAA
jgi:RimJ/RimL family protein N-acetyltransferase